MLLRDSWSLFKALHEVKHLLIYITYNTKLGKVFQSLPSWVVFEMANYRWRPHSPKVTSWFIHSLSLGLDKHIRDYNRKVLVNVYTAQSLNDIAHFLRLTINNSKYRFHGQGKCHKRNNEKHLEDDYCFVTPTQKPETWVEFILLSLMNSSASVMQLIQHISSCSDY